MAFDKRQVKLGLTASLVVFVASLFMLKPYLPKALWHNFAGLYDYTFFANRVVPAKNPNPWKVSTVLHAAPDAKTQDLLDKLETTSLLMIENDQIVYEKYSLDGGVDQLSSSFSMAKTILGLLTGYAIQEGTIRNVDAPISTWITEWEGSDSGKITIKNLLTMSSGLNWHESYSNPFSITAEAYYGSNLFFTTLRQRSIAEPGKKFIYQSGTSQLLGLTLARAVNKNLADYASSKLWGPIGAEKDALWSLDHEEGMEKAYCCFNARARDFAKIGQLILNRGKINGVQSLNESYVNDMLTPNQLLNDKNQPNQDYGYQTWLLPTPSGIIPYARGILGQYIIVVPQKNRVIVRLGKKRGTMVDQHPEEVRALAEWAKQ